MIVTSMPGQGFGELNGRHFLITELTARYIDAVVKIEQKSFSVPWSKHSLLSELKLKNSIALVALSNVPESRGHVVGYLFARHAASELEIVNLAVDPAWRRRKIAYSMLESVVSRAKSMNIKTIFLEVRERNNAAISLYKRFGFKMVGVRSGYYIDSGEDALMMRFEISR